MNRQYKRTYQYVNERAEEWLYQANIAQENGNSKREQQCLKKAQYWLDQLNYRDNLAGKESDGLK